MPRPTSNANPPPPRRNPRPLVTCPQCEHQQTERQFCQSCGVNMSTYRIDQAMADAQQRVERGWFWQAESARLLSLNLAGRIGRKGLLIAFVWIASIYHMGIIAIRWLEKPYLIYVALGISAIYLLRCCALRLHDLGLSAAWQFVPMLAAAGLWITGFRQEKWQWFIGGIYLVLMMIILSIPSQRRDNKFGLFVIHNTRGLWWSLFLAAVLAWGAWR